MQDLLTFDVKIKNGLNCVIAETTFTIPDEASRLTHSLTQWLHQERLALHDGDTITLRLLTN